MSHRTRNYENLKKDEGEKLSHREKCEAVCFYLGLRFKFLIGFFIKRQNELQATRNAELFLNKLKVSIIKLVRNM